MKHIIKISTETASMTRQIGQDKAIEIYGKVGFDCWDFSMFNLISYNWQTKELSKGPSPLNNDNYREIALQYRKIGEKYGMTCNQAHAPFPTAAPGMQPYIERAIECASIAGAKVIVIHPDNDKSPQENAEIFKHYLKLAHKYNIKIATENMWNWDKKEDHATSAACSEENNFLEHILCVNDPYLVACVDVGHASMKGLNTSPYKMIKKLSKYVECLHLHDVDGKYDNHQIPFSLSVDFTQVAKALKEINYKGELTLEADTYIKPGSIEELTKQAENLKKSADKIRDLYEAL